MCQSSVEYSVMSAHQSLFALAATAVTGFTLVTGLLLAPGLAEAAEPEAAIAKPHSQHKDGARKTASRKDPSPTDMARRQLARKAPRPQSTPMKTPAPAQSQPEQRSGAACTCPTTPTENSRPSLWPRPKYADLRPHFSESDEVATLENLQLALSETSDGGSYVWHRHNGWLSGLVQPTASFKDADGNVCRHIQVMLTSGTRSSRAEAIACRLPTGQWQFEH